MTEEELKRLLPDGTHRLYRVIPGALKAYRFKIQVSVLDCTGCGNWRDVWSIEEQGPDNETLETQLAEGKPLEHTCMKRWVTRTPW